MAMRRATCNCGRLELNCPSEPRRISMCHCLECQRRTGSVFGVQAWFPREGVSVIGESRDFTRISDAGNAVTFRFCPTCGSTVYWEAAAVPGMMAVAVGAFGDPSFPPPHLAVWEKRRHDWIEQIGSLPLKRAN